MAASVTCRREHLACLSPQPPAPLIRLPPQTQKCEIAFALRITQMSLLEIKCRLLNASLINNVLLLCRCWVSSETRPRRGGRRNSSLSLPPRTPSPIPAWCQKLILLWGLLSVFNQMLSFYAFLHNKSPPRKCRSRRWRLRGDR